ncbi:hypothetical protein LCGC14_0887090 [marine sediment metagenome]|uniref:Uncharacterized protein n=1 Tax=marine sediment metagenome TaxID=412755 RepID=A0A0F9S777_9ZZZZ
MKKILIIGSLLLSFLLISMGSAYAQSQPQCNERDNVLALLAKKYQETPIAAGVTNTGGLVEVLTDGKGGTWTIIVTTPQGMSCLVAAGEGWRWMKQVEPETGDKIRYAP